MTTPITLTTAAPTWRYATHLELLLNAAIPEDEFVRERGAGEIRQTYDDQIGSDPALSESVYQHHPYGRSVLGTEPELMKPRQRQCAVFTAHYQPKT